MVNSLHALWCSSVTTTLVCVLSSHPAWQYSDHHMGVCFILTSGTNTGVFCSQIQRDVAVWPPHGCVLFSHLAQCSSAGTTCIHVLFSYLVWHASHSYLQMFQTWILESQGMSSLLWFKRTNCLDWEKFLKNILGIVADAIAFGYTRMYKDPPCYMICRYIIINFYDFFTIPCPLHDCL